MIYSLNPNTKTILYGIKDARVIVVTPDIIDVWATELSYTGNFSLAPGQILVGQRFIDTVEEVTDIALEIGSTIGVDVLRDFYEPRGTQPFDPLLLNRQIIRNLTIAGIFDAVRPTIIAQS